MVPKLSLFLAYVCISKAFKFVVYVSNSKTFKFIVYALLAPKLSILLHVHGLMELHSFQDCCLSCIIHFRFSILLLMCAALELLGLWLMCYQLQSCQFFHFQVQLQSFQLTSIIDSKILIYHSFANSILIQILISSVIHNHKK